MGGLVFACAEMSGSIEGIFFTRRGWRWWLGFASRDDARQCQVVSRLKGVSRGISFASVAPLHGTFMHSFGSWRLWTEVGRVASSLPSRTLRSDNRS